MHIPVAAFLAASSIGLGIFGISPSQEVLIRDGMRDFSQNQVKTAVKRFDEVTQMDARYAPYLWQRGIAQYYNGQYKDCSAQFNLDLTVNSDDTEEAIWKYLCDTREQATAALSTGALEGHMGTSTRQGRLKLLPQPRKDPRPVMQVCNASTPFLSSPVPCPLFLGLTNLDPLPPRDQPMS